jgi:hypothetical protein
MTLRTGLMVPALVLGLLVAGCMRKQEAAVSSSAPSTAPAPAAAAPAAPAGNAPAASATPASPAANAPAAAAAAGDTVADTTAKLAAADWAIRQDQIKRDPDGQWATEATASSSYNDAQGDASWSPKQTTGVPDVDKYSDDGHAWAPKT